jgi:hypothetical protein
VLPEDGGAGVLVPMLDLKRAHPLAPDADIGKEFTLDLVTDPETRSALEGLSRVEGAASSRMPEISFAALVGADGSESYVSILRDTAHTNVAHLFEDGDRHVKTEDSLVVVRGFLGAYPNALFSIPRARLREFVLAVSKLDGDAAYRALRESFGVRRTDPAFWKFSDRLNAAYAGQAPLEGGLFDLNRLGEP